MQEVDNIEHILSEALISIKNNDPHRLKLLSNKTIHSATVHQDPDNVIVAVLVYALGKIVEREGYRNIEGWDSFYKSLVKNLTSSVKALESNDLEKFRNLMGKIRNSIGKIDSNLSIYIKDIFYKAEINKAFKIYEHGLSAEKTASLLGVSLWDLASYIGQSSISESRLNEAFPIQKRISNAKALTRKKIAVILDAGPLISLTLNGLLPILKKYKEKFPEIRFILTPQVKREVVDKALTIKKYSLEAVKVSNLIDKNVIELGEKIVDPKLLQKETTKMLNLANGVLKTDGKNLKILQEGEASCFAFANLCNCENLIVADERTARLLTESPENLRKIFEKRLHFSVNLNLKNVKDFKNYKFIRSSELLFIAYQNNLFEYKKDNVLLDALLYAVKYSGTSISSREIEDLKRLV